MFEPVIEPQLLHAQVRARHCHGISGTELRILALLYQGYRSEEIARLMGVAPATVRRHVADLCHRVFDLTDVPPERDKLRAWTGEHFDCCTLGAKEMIENDQKLA